MQVREMILEILKDGNWHGLGEIINHARKIITPERASQLYLCGGGKTKKLLGRPLEDQIDFGIRWEVLKQIRILVKRGKASQRGDKKNWEFKLGEPAKVQMVVDDVVNIQNHISAIERILAKYPITPKKTLEG